MTESPTLSSLVEQNVVASMNCTNITEIDLKQISIAKYVEPTGLLKEIKNYLMSRNKADSLWNESLALSCVSVGMGGDIYIAHEYGDIKGNLMLIIIGASGLAFKTVAKNQAQEIVKAFEKRKQLETLFKYGFSDLRDYKRQKKTHEKIEGKDKKTEKYQLAQDNFEAIKEELKFYDMPSQFTSEALTTLLCEQPEGIIFGDEFSGAYEGSKAKEYMRNLMETLSYLWDNRMPKTITIKRAIENPDNTYVTFISASTPYLLRIISNNFFLQGTGNRVLWIFKSKAEKIESAQRFLTVEGITYQNRKLNEIVESLARLRDLPKGAITVPENVALMLDKFQTDNYNKAVEIFNKDIFSTSISYIVRLAQNAYKIALINCVSRYVMDETPPQRMELSIEDAEYAMGIIMVYYENYLQMYNAKQILSNEGSNTKSYQADYDRIIFIITNKGGRATFNDIRMATGWKGEDIFNNLTEMQKAGIIRKSVELAGNHKEAEYYRLVPEGEEPSEPEPVPSIPITSIKSSSLAELFGNLEPNQ